MDVIEIIEGVMEHMSHDYLLQLQESVNCALEPEEDNN
jgi:hypothetical protein